ncbi:T9SS type A sorting domain-containing protein [Chryseobacterium soli]|uniref:T9SS type A sorting domain-containing protein n=1 Tax=Chryseobacterium soli TaxID=445961 RepID=UPI0009FF3BF1|nr:T9SS type A sorting domain-containing protein [Chryseobacterium soli]
MKKLLLSCLFMISMMLNAQIDLGTGSTNVGEAPISTYYGYSYVQQIFTKQEINANAAGNITGLKFYMDPSMSISNSSDWVVYVGHTSKTNFTSDTDWVPVNQLTQVYSGTVTNTNGVVEVTFAVPFPYNNTQNLVIAAEENAPGYDSNDYDDVFYVYDAMPSSSISFKNDNTNPNPLNPPAGNLNDYKSVVTLLGLTANAAPACPTVSYPGNNSTFIPQLPAITWYAPQGAASYKVSIGTTPGGTNIVNQQSVSTPSFTPSTPLALNTTFYLKVVSVGPGGESAGCYETIFKTIPPPPSNDDCTSAIELTVNPDMNCGSTMAGYTLGASDSGLIPDPCYGNPDDDVWYKFTATSAVHIISLSNVLSVGSLDTTDIEFQVFSGGCTGLSSILCESSETGIVTGLTPGQTYYVRLYSYDDAGAAQSFNICVGTIPPPPANDVCSGALSASVFPYTYTQSDAGGSTNNNGFITACPSAMNDGTWFTFTGDGTTFDITVTMPSGSIFDPKIGVYSGNCNILACEDTMDDEGQGGTETISVPTIAGTVYYVNVGYYSGVYDEMEWPFTINISKETLAVSEASQVKNKIRLYPNPAADILNISDTSKVKSVAISDFSGRIVKTVDNPGSAIQVGELKSGVYIVMLTMKDGSKQGIKIIKK